MTAKKCTKSGLHVQSCSFANLNLLLFDVFVAVVVALALYSLTHASAHGSCYKLLPHLQWGWAMVCPNRSYLRANSPGRSGGGAGKRRRACNCLSEIWILPPIPLWFPVDWAVRFPPISAKRIRARMWTIIEKHVPRVMTSLLTSSPLISISHRLFRCRYSDPREAVTSSTSFSRPVARASRRACLQAKQVLYFTHTSSIVTLRDQ